MSARSVRSSATVTLSGARLLAAALAMAGLAAAYVPGATPSVADAASVGSAAAPAASAPLAVQPVVALRSAQQPVQNLTLRPVADTYAVTSARRTNFGSRKYAFATTSVNRTLLKFDVRGRVPRGYKIAGAALRLYVMNVDTARTGLEVHPISSTWSETRLTASYRPRYRPARLNYPTAVTGERRWITVPIVRSTLSTTSPTAFELLHRVSYSRFMLAARESGGRSPQLVLRLTPPVQVAAKPTTPPASRPRAPKPTTSTTTVPPVPTTSTTTVPPVPTTSTTTVPPVPTTPTPSTTTVPPVPTTSTTTVPPVPTTPTPTATQTPSVSEWLPFEMPSTTILASSKKLAFAHYFTPFPLSIDNKSPELDYYTRNYLTTTGENGIHAAYGGLLRDRPLGRAPLSGDWAGKDFETEIRQARSGGLDGFAVDMLSISPTSYHWTRMNGLMSAAGRVDPRFKIMLQPDMTTLGAQTPEALAAAVAKLAAYPAAFRLADGRLVVSPFKAEAKTPQFWADWIALMKSAYNIDVAFVPTLLDWQKYASAFSSISYGFSHWGLRNPGSNTNNPKHAELAHSMGKIWMAPAHVQDARPSGGIYDEAGNTETLRLSWEGVVNSTTDWVNMPTWNDYSEGTSIAPSAKHGWSYLDISSYYIARWKLGKAPAIVRDGLYLTHRTQPYAALPTFAQTKLMKLRANTTPARDTVEALVFLKEPAKVTVKVGSATYTWDAPAGVNAKTFPLATGTVSGSVSRDGVTTTAATSPYAVTSTPYVQDLQYYAVSSLR